MKRLNINDEYFKIKENLKNKIVLERLVIDNMEKEIFYEKLYDKPLPYNSYLDKLNIIYYNDYEIVNYKLIEDNFINKGFSISKDYNVNLLFNSKRNIDYKLNSTMSTININNDLFSKKIVINSILDNDNKNKELMFLNLYVLDKKKNKTYSFINKELYLNNNNIYMLIDNNNLLFKKEHNFKVKERKILKQYNNFINDYNSIINNIFNNDDIKEYVIKRK